MNAAGLGLIRDLALSSSACTSAAAAASAALLYRSVARCEVLTVVDGAHGEWPLDISTQQPGSTAGAGTATGTAEHGQNYTLPKNYQLKTVWSVYSPYNLAFTAFRSAVFNLLPIWHEYFQQVEAAEEAAFAQGLEPLDEWPPFPREQVRPALDRSLWMSLRDLATLTVRRIYERIASQRFSVQTTTKLLKDARASAVRKSYLPFYKRLYRVSRTYFSANILGAAADCTVSVAVDTYRVIYRPSHEGRVQRNRKTVLRRFLRICAADVFRCSTCLVVAAAGAGIGAWLFTPVNRPGFGTFVGASAAEFGYTLFVVAPLVNHWAYGPDDRPPRIPAQPDAGLHDGERPPRLDGAAGGNNDVQLPDGD